MNPTYLLALGTAVPLVKMPQAKMADFMTHILHLAPTEARKLKALYRQTAIEHRYSVLHDFEQINSQFYVSGEAPFPTTAARMQLYEQEALPLAVAAVEDLRQNLRENAVSDTLHDISHLITVSCTGMYAPGLDIQLIEHYELSRGIHRTAINFMGCYASFNALKVGQAICQSQPEARVLIVGVELCTLHLQKSALEDDLIANSLFGDGAGAVLLSAHPQGKKNLCLSNFASSLLPQGKTEMAWH
ncbi:MAG: type III polyketide synthase, partial [Microscillaceae bacterium]|nr:type III polyketide synthase [Microscillaceae bacterium]